MSPHLKRTDDDGVFFPPGREFSGSGSPVCFLGFASKASLQKRPTGAPYQAQGWGCSATGVLLPGEGPRATPASQSLCWGAGVSSSLSSLPALADKGTEGEISGDLRCIQGLSSPKARFSSGKQGGGEKGGTHQPGAASSSSLHTQGKGRREPEAPMSSPEVTLGFALAPRG